MSGPPITTTRLSSVSSILAADQLNSTLHKDSPATLSARLAIGLVICPVAFFLLIAGFCRVARRGPLLPPFPTARLRSEARDVLATFMAWPWVSSPAFGSSRADDERFHESPATMTVPLPVYTPATLSRPSPPYTPRESLPPPEYTLPAASSYTQQLNDGP